MAVDIVITVAGQGSGSGGEAREFAYSLIDPTPPLVTLSIDDVTGVTSYTWELLNIPIDSTSTLSSASSPTPTFTPTAEKWGTYLIRCTIIRNGSSEVETNALSFRTPNRDMRFPAAGEKIEFSDTNGWMEAEFVLYEIVDNLNDAGYWERVGTILSPDTDGDTIQVGSGTYSNPGYAYELDPDTGRYLFSAGVEAFSSGGGGQLLFGNDGNPYIKAFDGHQYLKIGNYNTTSGSVISGVTVEAVGDTGNDGGTLTLQATAPSNKTALSYLQSINTSGTATSTVLADSGSSASATATALVQSTGQGPTVTNIYSDADTNDVNSAINIKGTSALGNSTITIETDAPTGGKVGRVVIGGDDTDEVRFVDKYYDASSVTWTVPSLPLSTELGEWDNFDSNFGEESLLYALNWLHDNAAGITVSGGTGIRIDSVADDREVNVEDAPASEIDFASINGSSYKPLQNYFNFKQSQTKLTNASGVITDGGSGTINVAAGDGIAKSSDAINASTVFFSWSSSSGVSVTDDDVNYVFAVYHPTTPYLTVSTNASLTSRRDYIFLGLVKREGTDIDIRNLDPNNDVVWRLQRKSSIQSNYGPEYGNGIIIGDGGTRYITITAGYTFFGINEYTNSAIDTSVSDTFSTFYTSDSGSSWTETASQTQIDNTYYNNITTGLVELTVNQYGVHWVYMDYSGDHVYVLYGNDSYGSLALAQEAGEPAIRPWQINEWGFLIGKVIIQKSDTEITEVTSVFLDDVGGGASVSTHNLLSGLQGGTTSQYYHLTSDDYIDLTDNLPIGTGAVVFGNSDGELDHDVTNFYNLTTSGLWKTVNAAGTSTLFLDAVASSTATLDLESEGDTTSQIYLKAVNGAASGGTVLNILSDATTSGGGGSSVATFEANATDNDATIDILSETDGATGGDASINIDATRTGSNNANIALTADTNITATADATMQIQGLTTNIYSVNTGGAATTYAKADGNTTGTLQLESIAGVSAYTQLKALSDTALGTTTLEVYSDATASTGGGNALSKFYTNSTGADATIEIFADESGGVSGTSLIDLKSSMGSSNYELRLGSSLQYRESGIPLLGIASDTTTDNVKIAATSHTTNRDFTIENSQSNGTAALNCYSTANGYDSTIEIFATESGGVSGTSLIDLKSTMGSSNYELRLGSSLQYRESGIPLLGISSQTTTDNVLVSATSHTTARDFTVQNSQSNGTSTLNLYGLSTAQDAVVNIKADCTTSGDAEINITTESDLGDASINLSTTAAGPNTGDINIDTSLLTITGTYTIIDMVNCEIVVDSTDTIGLADPGLRASAWTDDHFYLSSGGTQWSNFMDMFDDGVTMLGAWMGPRAYYPYRAAPQTVSNSTGTLTIDVEDTDGCIVRATIDQNITTFALTAPTYCMSAYILIYNSDSSSHTVVAPTNATFLEPYTAPLTIAAGETVRLSCMYLGSTYEWEISAVYEAS